MLTKDTVLPSYSELEVDEVPVGTPYLKAGANHLGKYCEAQNNEFMLCRQETLDPVKCLNDGKEVTKCTNKFFNEVKRTCAAEFTTYAMCLERSSSDMKLMPCRKTQMAFDACVKDNLGWERPHYAYFTMAKVHETARPPPSEGRPKWLDDPRGAGGRPEILPKDFPMPPPNYHAGSNRL